MHHASLPSLAHGPNRNEGNATGRAQGPRQREEPMERSRMEIARVRFQRNRCVHQLGPTEGGAAGTVHEVPPSNRPASFSLHLAVCVPGYPLAKQTRSRTPRDHPTSVSIGRGDLIAATLEIGHFPPLQRASTPLDDCVSLVGSSRHGATLRPCGRRAAPASRRSSASNCGP